MPKYAVIYWKNLDKDNITTKGFDDEHEMVDFVESKRISGYAVMVGEESYVNVKGEKTYKMRPFGAYNFFKRIYGYVGIFLVVIIILIILMWKHDFK
jgi:hypothetical protein